MCAGKYVCLHQEVCLSTLKGRGALGVGDRKRKQNGPLSSFLFQPQGESKRSLLNSHQGQPRSPRERSYKTLGQMPGGKPDPWFLNIQSRAY